jgi:hypothetical protein
VIFLDNDQVLNYLVLCPHTTPQVPNYNLASAAAVPPPHRSTVSHSVTRLGHVCAATSKSSSADTSNLRPFDSLFRNPANRRSQQPQGTTEQAAGNSSPRPEPAEYSMERALLWSTSPASRKLPPQRWSAALTLMRDVKQEVTAQLAAENGGSVRLMRWLVASANSTAKNPTAADVTGHTAQLILLVAGPGGRTAAGRRSSEIVALELDTDGFPVGVASSPTAAINAVLKRAVTNYKNTLWVNAPSLQKRGRASGSTGGWVPLRQWLQCMYTRTGTRQATAAAAAAAGRGPCMARSSRSGGTAADPGAVAVPSSRNGSSSSSATGRSGLGSIPLEDPPSRRVGIVASSATGVPERITGRNGSGSGSGSSHRNRQGCDSNSSSSGVSSMDEQAQLMVTEAELVQLLRTLLAPAQLQQQLPRLIRTRAV